MPPWLVDSLIEDLRAEGLDARILGSFVGLLVRAIVVESLALSVGVGIAVFLGSVLYSGATKLRGVASNRATLTDALSQRADSLAKLREYLFHESQ